MPGVPSVRTSHDRRRSAWWPKCRAAGLRRGDRVFGADLLAVSVEQLTARCLWTAVGRLPRHHEAVAGAERSSAGSEAAVGGVDDEGVSPWRRYDRRADDLDAGASAIGVDIDVIEPVACALPLSVTPIVTSRPLSKPSV